MMKNHSDRVLPGIIHDDNIAIKAVRQLHYSAGSKEPFHAHEEGQLIYPLRGVAKVRTAQHVWVLATTHALWLPGGLPHGLEAVDGVITHNIYLSASASQAYSQQCRGLTVTPLLQALTTAGLESGVEPARQRLIHAMLHNELSQLTASTLCHITLPRDRRLRQVCDALSSNLSYGETLSWWGKQVGASERTLARLFREETTLSFSEWRQQMRLVEAVCHLARGSTINSLATELGYASASAFIAMFRKKLGISPQRYLQQGK